jgi:hypothetical protein
MKSFGIPEVPDDQQTRQDAIECATRNIEIVQNRQEEVDRVTESISKVRDRNHFADRLGLAYGIRQ